MIGTLKLTVGSGDEAAKSESSDNLHDDCEWIYTATVMMMLACTNSYTCRLSLCFSGIHHNVSKAALYPTHAILTLVAVASDRTFWSYVTA